MSRTRPSQQARYRHIAGATFFLALELAAGLMLQTWGWLIVGALMLVGAILYFVAYLPDIRKHLKIRYLSEITTFALSTGALCFLLGSYISFAYGHFSIRDPALFEPSPVARKNADGTDRVFVSVLPSELMDRVKSSTSYEAKGILAPYAGKWIAISGDVSDMISEAISENIMVTLAQRASPGIVALTFDKKWTDRLQVLGKGDHLSAYCKIAPFQFYSFSLQDCELADQEAH